MVAPNRTDAKCSVCKGIIECKGGGNLACYKRDPRPSVLAGIIDSYGGLRFVITQVDTLSNHVRDGELLVVVPNITVHEPLAWDHIPIVTARIEWWIEEWIKTRPNLDENGHEAIKMYRLRQSEQVRRSLDLTAIVYT